MIPADHITFDGVMAWLVLPGTHDYPNDIAGYDCPICHMPPEVHPWPHIEAADRPCDTCGGRAYLRSTKYQEKCLDCIDGRHTFDIEVECEVCDELRRKYTNGEIDFAGGCPNPRTHRVSIIPGMVLSLQLDPSPGSRKVGYDGQQWWYYDTTTEPWHHEIVALPSAAKPGMWCVQLRTDRAESDVL